MALVREGLTALISRLKDLLDEYSGNTQHHCNSTLTFFILFPGNALLEQLVKIARRILSFPVASPLMRVLVGLELLNAKLHDWEMNASREVSLAPHIEVRAQASQAKFFVCLTRESQHNAKVIRRWRRLELQSWPSIVASRFQSHELKAEKFWFHLYGLLINYQNPEPENPVTAGFAVPQTEAAVALQVCSLPPLLCKREKSQHPIYN